MIAFHVEWLSLGEIYFWIQIFGVCAISAWEWDQSIRRKNVELTKCYGLFFVNTKSLTDGTELHSESCVNYRKLISPSMRIEYIRSRVCIQLYVLVLMLTVHILCIWMLESKERLCEREKDVCCANWCALQSLSLSHSRFTFSNSTYTSHRDILIKYD